MLEAECGKGAYVRAIARDLGRALGCYGHVVELRRTRVGPFLADAAVPLDRLPDDAELMARAMLPLQAGLAELASLPVDRNGAAILRRGQPLLLRGAAPAAGPAWAACFGTPVAFGVIEDGYFVSTPGVQHQAIALISRRRTPFPASPRRPPISGTRAWRSGRR